MKGLFDPLRGGDFQVRTAALEVKVANSDSILTFLGYVISRKQSNRSSLENKEENSFPISVSQFGLD